MFLSRLDSPSLPLPLCGAQVRKNAIGLKGTPGFGGNYPVETGERLHIVVTTDVIESTMVIYINGVETGTSTGTFGWAPDIEARSSFIIGGSLDVNGGVVNAFEGACGVP